jgi:intein/homing endonuclease
VRELRGRGLEGRESDHEDEIAGLAFKALDEGLRSVLGESVTKALYYHFEERAGLKVEEALERPEGSKAFTRFLREFFDYGYDALERIIVEVMSKRVGIRASSLSEALSLLSSRSTSRSTQCSTCPRE